MPRTLSDSCVNISYLSHALFAQARDLQSFQTAKMAFKVTQGAFNDQPEL